MGITERKERQKAELREAILNAARRIFVDEGSEALSMRRIADAIEYSPATIYLYFASREEIALQLVHQGFAMLLAALEPALAIADPVERIRAIGQAYIAFGQSNPQTYKLIFMENSKYVYAVLSPEGTLDCEASGRRAFDGLTAAIEEAVACGRFKAIDADRAAEAFWAGVHGIVSLSITCPMMIGDLTAAAAVLEDALITGFSRTESAG